jgi:hypothetical protein
MAMVRVSVADDAVMLKQEWLTVGIVTFRLCETD